MSDGTKRGVITSFVDWFVPAKLQSASPDELRRARLTVVFCIAMGLNSAPNILVLLGNRVWSVGTMISLMTSLYLVIPFAFRYTGSLRLAAHLLVANGIVGNLICSSFSGGVLSPGLVWNGAPLIFAVMLLGTRVGLFWTVVVTAECIIYIPLHKAGILRDDVALLDRHEAIGSSAATAFIAFFLLVRVYENLKKSMLEQIGHGKRLVEKAHQNARLVLDNVGQGLLVADGSGAVGAERSEALNRWFGPASPEESLFTYFEKVDSRFAEWLEVGWSSVFEEFLPVEVCIAQLPARLVHLGRHYSVTYRLITGAMLVGSRTLTAPQPNEPVKGVLMVVSDITEVVKAERAEEEQRELLALLQRAMADRGILVGFLEESRFRIKALCETTLDRTVEQREIHTLKGNAGLFGLIQIPRLCHELEEKLAQDDRSLNEEERLALRQLWDQIETRAMPLLGEDTSSIQLSKSEYNGVLHAVANGEPHSALHSIIRSWAHEPTHKRLGIVAEQIAALGRRLGKGDITVQIDDGGIRLPRERLREFWSSLSHVVRNAVDHGLETPEERRGNGKPVHPRIRLATHIDHADTIIEIEDDGRGIDWSAVSEKARAKGLPTHTKQQLEAALFADGLTTRSEATDISGRGVGLAAVQSAVDALGGTISLESTKGQGTRFSFRFNLARLRPSLACPPTMSDHPTNGVHGRKIGLIAS